ncbi:START domain-containing protein [Sediminibacterium soli]|uniref:START domain-containing protein n=1 Tax=Sediminibacterium soli TaxID=2698829 RepID=UPI00137B8478|nr:START domain-containing protein [Sediminibacterium soli]NCI47872.1 lipid-binding protein [Sediminibacterium soli]
MRKLSAMIVLACLLCSGAGAQDWKLRTNKNGIRVYAREVPGSRIHALKVESTFDVPASRLVAVILDIEGATDWLYSTKSCIPVKTMSAADVYYYSEIKFPWPVANRDFVAHLTISQDASTKTIHAHAENVSDMVPEKKGIVRVTQSIGNWTIQPLNSNQAYVQYELQVDPAGALPAWLVNMLSSRGPYESFFNLKTQLQKSKYAGAKYAFITD